MFNVGGPEIVVIFLVALIVLGPQQLPKAMRTFGSVMAEVRKVSNSFQAEMRSAMDTITDTTGTEKPQSGSMAAATPQSTGAADTPSTPASPVIDSSGSEVVARSPQPVDDDASADPAAIAAEHLAAEGPDRSEPARPAIDPADRAAG